MTGHTERHKVAWCGEFMHFKLATDPTRRNKFDGEWLDGYFAGVIARWAEDVVIRGDQVYKFPTIRRRTEEEAYNKEALDSMRANFFDHVRVGAKTRVLEITSPEGT